MCRYDVQLLYGNFQSYEIQEPYKLIRNFKYFSEKHFYVTYYTTTIVTIFIFGAKDMEFGIQEGAGQIGIWLNNKSVFRKKFNKETLIENSKRG